MFTKCLLFPRLSRHQGPLKPKGRLAQQRMTHHGFNGNPGTSTPIARMFKKKYGPHFDKDPHYTRLVWDTIAAAVLIDPTLITEQQNRSVDVNSDYALDYGPPPTQN